MAPTPGTPERLPRAALRAGTNSRNILPGIPPPPACTTLMTSSRPVCESTPSLNSSAGPVCEPDCPVALIDGQPHPGREISRLFYASKASRGEREAGCERLPERQMPIYTGRAPRLVRNIHPTVKPIELMRWLTRLICPPGGTVLDPFTGSGSNRRGVCAGRPTVRRHRAGQAVCVGNASADRLLGQAARTGAGWLDGVHDEHGENQRRPEGCPSCVPLPHPLQTRETWR